MIDGTIHATAADAVEGGCNYSTSLDGARQLHAAYKERYGIPYALLSVADGFEVMIATVAIPYYEELVIEVS